MSETIRTNIVLDKNILEKALQTTGMKTRRERIDYALHELVRHGQQQKLLDLKGQINWQGDLDEMRAK